MRITEIQIDGFGKWQSTNFELSPELQIFFGSNESGKSTLTQFIISVIFGFQNHLGKNKYLQYIPKNTASYGGVIVFEHKGETYRLKRTKGKKVAGKIEFSTLDGEKLTEDELNEVLAPMNETLFRTLFSFSQTDLNQIFDLSKNDIDAALQQMGTVGSSQWLDLAKNFDKSAGQIYKDGGQVPTLNVKLNHRQELINKINTAKQDYNRYHQLVTDNDKDVAEQVKIVDQLAEIRKQEQQLDQLNRLMPIFEKLKINETNEAIKFTSNDEIDVNQNETQINELQNGITRNQTQLSVINDKKFTSAKQQFYFDHLADFEAAYREIPTVKQAVSSREQLMDEIQRVSNAVNEIKAKYGQVPEPLSEAQQAQLDKLLTQKSQISEQQDVIVQTRSASQKKSSQLPLVFAIVGLVGLVTAVLVSSFIGRSIGIVVMIIGVIGWYINSHQTSINTNEPKKNQDLVDVENELQQFGQDNGFESFPQNQWLAIQYELNNYVNFTHQLAKFENELSDDELIIDNFITKYANLDSWIDGDDLASSIVKIEEYHGEQSTAVENYRNAKEKSRLLTEQIEQQTEKLKQAQLQQRILLQKIGVANVAEFKVKYQSQLDEVNENAEQTALANQINPEQQRQLAEYRNAGELQTELQNSREQLNTLTINRDNIESEINRRNFEINAIAQNGLLTELTQDLADLEAEINELAGKWLKAHFSILWINQTLQAASQDRFPQIVQQAKRYFQLLTNNHYQDIVVDEVIKVVDNTNTEFEVGELSQGTAEQLYVALRFGFATVMNQEINFPFIIDDGFVNFDNIRKNRTIELLKELSKQNQVIYFTADDRILRMYNNEQVINLDEK